jgi:deoxyribodipyrimidine photolyase
MDPTTTITWFRRDLRVHDHPALVAASETADRPVRAWFLRRRS